MPHIMDGDDCAQRTFRSPRKVARLSEPLDEAACAAADKEMGVVRELTLWSFRKFAAKHNCSSFEEARELMYRKVLERRAQRTRDIQSAPHPDPLHILHTSGSLILIRPPDGNLEARCRRSSTKKAAGRQASTALQPGRSQCTAAAAEGVQLVAAELSAVHLQCGLSSEGRAASLSSSLCSKL